MKTKLRDRMVAIMAFLTIVGFVNAQTTVTDFAGLQSALTAGGDIIIGAPITIPSDFTMAPSVPITITTTGPFTPAQPLLSVTGGTLTIGNNVTINAGGVANAISAMAGGSVVINGGVISSTATSPLNVAGGTITVNGGTITTSNFPAAAAGSSIGSGGTLIVNGGVLSTTNTGTLTRGIVVDYGGTCYVNGGEIHADPSVSGRGISINSTNSGGKLYITGGTITAAGSSGRAIQLDNANAFLSVSGSPVISGGLEGIIAQKGGIVIIQGTPSIKGIIGCNSSTTTGQVYDCRHITPIVANPVAGSYTTDQPVTLTGGMVDRYNSTNQTTPVSVPATLVYTTDGTTPTTTSAVYTAPVTAVAPATTITVTPMINNILIGDPVAFTYTIATGITAPQAVGKVNSLIVNTIDASAIEGVQDITVYDLTGRVVLSAHNQSVVDASSLSTGAYILQVKTAKGGFTQRVVKQ